MRLAVLLALAVAACREPVRPPVDVASVIEVEPAHAPEPIARETPAQGAGTHEAASREGPRLVTRIVDGNLVIEELPPDLEIAREGAAGAPDASAAFANARDVNARDVNARDVNAHDANAHDANAHDANAPDASALAAGDARAEASASASATNAGASGDACISGRTEMAALVVRAARGEAVAALDAANAVQRSAGACRMDAPMRTSRAQVLLAAAKLLPEPRAQRALLEESVDLAPGVESLTLLAKAADADNDLRFALERYREADQLAPRSGAFRSRIRDLEKKLAVEAGFEKRETQHFIARFEGDERADLADNALSSLNEARTKLRDRVGLVAPAPITVVLYIGDQYQRATSGPDWSGGVFDGKIRIKEGQLTLARGDLDDVLVHEYVHALLRNAVQGGVPAWFNEGLAQYFEPGGDRADIERRLRSKARVDLPTLAQLSRGFGLQRDRDVARRYYDCALDLVDEMVRWRSERSLTSLLEAMNAGKRFEVAFEEVYGMDLALFEQRWRSRYP